MKRSSAYLIAGVFGLLLVGLALSVLHERRQRAQADRAREQAIHVRDLAQQVRALTDRPSLVLTQSDEIKQLNGLVEVTAKQCGIQPDAIEGFDAQEARRIGKTPYYRLPTRVSLTEIKLHQAADLLARLTADGHIHLEDCRFVAPHDQTVGNTWNAEFTLAYLVYDPGSAPGSAPGSPE